MAKAEYPIHAKKRGLIAKALKDSDACLIAAAPEMLSLLAEISKLNAAQVAPAYAKLAASLVAKATGGHP